eukprot:Rhum_TRINITY_DN14133_c0_g1::Rhum_TRINITY_DN14133_c0_g1_i2::g.70096::m.70096/K01081/E3.1.3.5; 5'-nucleotidase
MTESGPLWTQPPAEHDATLVARAPRAPPKETRGAAGAPLRATHTSAPPPLPPLQGGEQPQQPQPQGRRFNTPRELQKLLFLITPAKKPAAPPVSPPAQAAEEAPQTPAAQPGAASPVLAPKDSASQATPPALPHEPPSRPPPPALAPPPLPQEAPRAKAQPQLGVSTPNTEALVDAPQLELETPSADFPLFPSTPSVHPPSPTQAAGSAFDVEANPRRLSAMSVTAPSPKGSTTRRLKEDAVAARRRGSVQFVDGDAEVTREYSRSSHDSTPGFKRYDTTRMFERCMSQINVGHGVALYQGLRMRLGEQNGQPEGEAFTDIEIRVTSNTLVIHEHHASDLTGGSVNTSFPILPAYKPLAKIPLVTILSANVDSGTSTLTVVLRKQESSERAREGSYCSTVSSERSSSAAPNTETFEVTSDDADLLAELVVCMQHQQIKAFHAELGRVRKSLKPSGGRKIDVVHFNDVYHLGVYKKDEPCGGITRFYEQLEMLRRKKNPLVLFSGDFVGPSLMSVITKGKQMVDALNFLGTHYGVFGNHEFDFGLRNLHRIIHGYTHGEFIFAGSTTEWLMSNMAEKNGQPLGGVTKSKVLEWNGIMIGIVGLCENWLPHCPRLTKGEAVYADMFEVGESEARALKHEGAEIVIALTHNRLAMDKELTNRCPSIDLLLGGHDHFYKKALDARVIKSGEEFQWLSEVQITLDDAPPRPAAGARAGGGPTLPPSTPCQIQCKTHAISSTLPESKMIRKLVQRYGEKMTEKMGKVVGKSAYPLDSTEETCRFKEGRLTNFLADLMQSETGADCAVLGGAAVAGKSVLEPGQISIGDVFNWFPDEIKIQTVEMPGRWLVEMLRLCVKELPDECPSFPHTSQQLTFTINMLPKAKGEPNVVENVRIDGELVNPDMNYTVAVTDFVASGKERFKFIKDHCHVLTEAEHAEQFSMWILDYFKQKKGDKKKEPAPGKRNSHAQIPAHARRHRRSSLHPLDDKQDMLGGGMEGFDLKDDDFADLDLDMMRKVMIALSRLSEEKDTKKAKTFITSIVRQLLGCDRATIFLANHVQQTLNFLPDGSSSELAIPITAGIAGLCASEGEVLHIPDAYQDSRFNQSIDKQTGYRTRDILACPVKKEDGSVVAVMQAVNKMKGGFCERDKRLLILFGKQTALHLSHAEMFETMRKNQEATQTLLKIAKDISSDVSMDMKTMVACIMSGSSQLMRCDRSSLFLVDNKTEEMWTIVVDPSTKTENIIRLPLGTGIAGHVAVTGNKLNLKDAYDCKLFNPAFDRKSGYRTKTVLCVPIFTMEGSSDVLGVLQFINKLDGSEFGPQVCAKKKQKKNTPVHFHTRVVHTSPHKQATMIHLTTP